MNTSFVSITALITLFIPHGIRKKTISDPLYTIKKKSFTNTILLK